MKLFRVLLFIGMTAASAVAQTNAPQTRAVSLEDCIAIALQHNFDIQIRRYEPLISRYSLAGVYGSYEPTFSASAVHDYSLSPGGIDSEGRPFGGTESEADRFSSGLSGVLPWGTIYNLGASVSDQTTIRPSVIVDPNTPAGTFTNQFFVSELGQTVTLIGTNFVTINTRNTVETFTGNAGALTLQQPLLKDFWIDGVRYQIYVSKRESQMSDERFRDQVMVTVTSVEGAYYNLVSAEDSVVVQEKGLELARRLLAENKKRVEVGALAPLDEKQAEAQVASSEAELLAAQGSRDTAERVLKDVLSDNYTNDWADISIVPTDRLLAVSQQYDLQESWRKGLAQSPKLIIARLTLDVSKGNVRYSRNQLFPRLDLIGSYGYSASADSYSGTFDQIGHGDNPFWSIGAQFSIPLGETGARNSYKIAKAGRERDTLGLKQLEQKLLILIEDDIAGARTSFERVSATREASNYAEAALEAEQKKLESGKSTSFVVLQLQRDLTTARGSEIRALADYNIAVAKLAYDEGSVLDRRRIQLNMKDLRGEMLP